MGTVGAGHRLKIGLGSCIRRAPFGCGLDGNEKVGWSEVHTTPRPDFPDGKNRLYIATPLLRATRPPVFPQLQRPKNFSLSLSSSLFRILSASAEGCVARGRLDVVISGGFVSLPLPWHSQPWPIYFSRIFDELC